MKPLKSILIIFLLPVFFFFACSKSSDNPPPKTKTELLTPASWKFDHATAAGIGDVSALIPSCYKDNIVVFAAGGTGNISEETNICTPSTAGNFTWSFQDNEKKLVLSTSLFTGGSGTFDLISLTETNLVVSQQMTIQPYPATTVEVTFKH